MRCSSKLSTRYGYEISEPRELDRRYAIADFFNEHDPSLVAAHERNVVAWFAVARETEGEKSFYGIEVHREGYAVLQSWADSSATLEFEYEAQVTEADAVFLWDQLSRRKVTSFLLGFCRMMVGWIRVHCPRHDKTGRTLPSCRWI